jgi:hypothetical protein
VKIHILLLLVLGTSCYAPWGMGVIDFAEYEEILRLPEQFSMETEKQEFVVFFEDDESLTNIQQHLESAIAHAELYAPDFLHSPCTAEHIYVVAIDSEDWDIQDANALVWKFDEIWNSSGCEIQRWALHIKRESSQGLLRHEFFHVLLADRISGTVEQHAWMNKNCLYYYPFGKIKEGRPAGCTPPADPLKEHGCTH